MRGKQLCAVILTLILALTALAGCSAKAEVGGNSAADGYYGVLTDSVNDSSSNAPQESGKSLASVGNADQKLVRTMHIEAETNDMDVLMGELDSRIRTLGGYVENKSVRNGGSSSTRRYRYADMTIRIPADLLDEFMTHISGQTNVVYYKENADDITLRYVATQSRVSALETEQRRLLELLAKAEDMSDLLLIEERLTNVRAELEEVTSQMRIYDNMVDYGTVQLTVTEVQVYTPVEEDTVWQKIGSGLTESWQNLCAGAEAVFVFLVISLPYWIPIGAAIGITVVAVKLATRKTKKKEGPSPSPEQAE